MSGTVQIAVRQKATTATPSAAGRLRSGRRCSQITTAPTATNTATMRWLMTVAASSAAGSASPFRSSSDRARAPMKNSPRARAMVKENSPARLLARFPPQIV